jgi:hypothetical protein
MLGRPIELTRFLQIALGLAVTLREAHRRGLVHMDIRPWDLTRPSRNASSNPSSRRNPKAPACDLRSADRLWKTIAAACGSRRAYRMERPSCFTVPAELAL